MGNNLEEKLQAVEAVFKYLPQDLKEDKVVAKILSDSINDAEISVSPGLITVSKELYDKVTLEHPELRKFYEIYSDESGRSILGYLTFPYHVMIKKPVNEKAKEKYNITITKHEYTISITFFQNYDFIKEVYKKEEPLTFEIIDYKCDMGLCDKMGNPLKLKNKDLMIDQEFAVEFNIPVEMVNFFRMNFKKFQKKLNISRAKGTEDIANSNISDDYQYTFIEPFSLNNVIREIENKREKFLDNLNNIWNNSIDALAEDEELIFDPTIDGSVYDDYIPKEIPDFDQEKHNQKLAKIELLLNNIFGKSGEVMLSLRMYTKIEEYLNEFGIDLLYGDGLAIKKEHGEFTLYYVHFDDDKVISIPKPISKEEALKLYNNSEFNSPLYGEEFFGLERNRS